MSRKTGSIQQIVEDAIERGAALGSSDIRALRNKSEQAVKLSKTIFWVGIIIVNLLIWAPIPLGIDRTVLIIIGAVALAIAIIVPIVGLKRHQMNLEMLQPAQQAPRRKAASEAGRAYIEQVKKQDRLFVVAEFEVLERSKSAGKVAAGTNRLKARS